MEDYRGFDSWLAASTARQPLGVGAAFASGCAERLLASTARSLSVEQFGLCRSALDMAWAAAAASQVDPVSVQEAADHLAETAVTLDESAVPLVVSTLALASYAASAATGTEPKAVAWASQVVFEALDTATLVARPQIMDAAAREAWFSGFWQHWLVCQEVARERRDLDELVHASAAPEVVSDVRRRALLEPMLG